MKAIDEDYGTSCGDSGCTEIDGVIRLGRHAFAYLAHMAIDGDAMTNVDIDIDHGRLTEAADVYFHRHPDYVCERIGVHAATVLNLRAVDAPESLARKQGRPN
jgi:hypothetical protein